MKGKLTLLGLLATAVTVGGVYATWTFAEGNVAEATTTVNVSMTGVNSSTEKGTLSVMVMTTNGFTLAVDDANNDHYADIKKTGDITVTFKPAADASQDIRTNGIDVQCVISYAPYAGGADTIADWTYDGKQIFEIVNNASAPMLLNKSAATYDNSTGTFTWTISHSDYEFVKLANDFYIDTLAKYNAMNAELAKGHFVLTVSEYTPIVNS